MLYFTDNAMADRLHPGFIDHEELELDGDEIEALKARARKAVTMDGRGGQPARPSEYQQFLDGGQRSGGGDAYAAFLRGEG